MVARTHKRAAIVVSKAERSLTLYRNGQKVVSYPVRLGFNGIKEKRYQGDGATPEGRYRILSKRGRGRPNSIMLCYWTIPTRTIGGAFSPSARWGTFPCCAGLEGKSRSMAWKTS